MRAWGAQVRSAFLHFLGCSEAFYQALAAKLQARRKVACSDALVRLRACAGDACLEFLPLKHLQQPRSTSPQLCLHEFCSSVARSAVARAVLCCQALLPCYLQVDERYAVGARADSVRHRRV